MPRLRFDDAMLAVSGLLPAALGAAGITSSAPASHDEAVVRVVGLGWTGLYRGLDAMIAAPFMLLPIGTRALRAGIASAVVAGLCGVAAFVIARRLARAVRPEARSPRLVSAVAAVAAMTAVMAPLWQVEAAAPGGAVVGALIVLAAVIVGADANADADAKADADANADADAKANAKANSLGGVALLLGLGVSYEPLVAAAVVAAVVPWVEGMVRARRVDQRVVVAALPAFGIGLMPLLFGWALSTRTPEIAVSGARPFASSIDEIAKHGAVGAIAIAEIGTLMLVAAAAGMVLTALVPAARRWLASLLGVVVVGVIALLSNVATGPTHAAPAILAATCAVHVVASIALLGAVDAIASARVPFAQASAVLVVVLELVLPVRAADETLGRREARSANASTVWNEVAWGAAPPAAVVLVSDRATMRRVAASRATGEHRADLVMVPTFAMRSRATDRALKAEPKLAPLYRDIALGSTPEELSLATLASSRPLLAGFDPKWDKNLARHFVPVGLTTRFEPEPRGASDRRKGLDAFTAAKERLVRVAVARRDPDLATATATLLRGRAIGMAACGERDVLSRALDDLRPFAPDDPVASTLVRRIVTSKGPIEVRDLVP